MEGQKDQRFQPRFLSLFFFLALLLFSLSRDSFCFLGDRRSFSGRISVETSPAATVMSIFSSDGLIYSSEEGSWLVVISVETSTAATVMLIFSWDGRISLLEEGFLLSRDFGENVHGSDGGVNPFLLERADIHIGRKFTFSHEFGRGLHGSALMLISSRDGLRVLVDGGLCPGTISVSPPTAIIVVSTSGCTTGWTGCDRKINSAPHTLAGINIRWWNTLVSIQVASQAQKTTRSSL